MATHSIPRNGSIKAAEARTASYAKPWRPVTTTVCGYTSAIGFDYAGGTPDFRLRTGTPEQLEDVLQKLNAYPRSVSALRIIAGYTPADGSILLAAGLAAAALAEVDL